MSSPKKFRGKRLDNGEWVYGDLFQSKYGTAILVNRDDKDLDPGWYYPNDVFECKQVDPETVGQLTTIPDKNKQNIWEGDIVKQTYHKEIRDFDNSWMCIDGHHIGRVIMTASAGVCMVNPLHYSIDDDTTAISKQYKKVAGYRCEVIGNVHDNPELLAI
ncbi:YopX family protein [Paenibacillus albiflavus]|nr:YopX family protein [Paenibacillus albiflavus]